MEVQKPDGKLADPPINSGKQFQTLLKDRYFVLLFAKWLKVRAGKALRERTLTDIQDQINKTRDQSDDDFLQKLYMFIYHRERPAPCIQAPPNTYKR